MHTVREVLGWIFALASLILVFRAAGKISGGLGSFIGLAQAHRERIASGESAEEIKHDDGFSKAIKEAEAQPFGMRDLLIGSALAIVAAFLLAK